MTVFATTSRRFVMGLALSTVLVVSGCGSDDKENQVQTTTKDAPVCNLVDPALAAEVVGSDEFKTTGPGAIPRDKRNTGGAHCVITRDSGAGPSIQVRLGEVPSATEWTATLEQEAKTLTYGEVVATYTGDPGVGYGVTYEGGIYALGAGVNIVRGDRVVRVTVSQWPDATPEQRLAAAEKIAVNADENLTAFDQAQ